MVLSAGASFSKDEMTIGGLYAIDRLDVVATFVPEEKAWRLKAAETSTTEFQLLNRDQYTIAELDCDDPKASEAMVALWKDLPR